MIFLITSNSLSCNFEYFYSFSPFTPKVKQSVSEQNPSLWSEQLLSSPEVQYIVLNEVVRTSASVDEILKQFFSCGIVHCAVQGGSNV